MIFFDNRHSHHQSKDFYRHRVGVIILCGGEGKRLAPLTNNRCKPTVSFGGRYKLIDIPISHAITSGFSKIFVIGQYMTYTLQQHLFKTYFYHGVIQDQIHLLVPEARSGTQDQVWYKGTADAIRQNLLYFKDCDVDYFLILSGDQLYNMDFRNMIDYIIDHQADMVIAAQPVSERDASRFGLLQVDNQGSLIDFYEKPTDPVILNKFRIDEADKKRKGFTNTSGSFLGSMGIYVFRKETLFSLLNEEGGDDFGKHIILSQMHKGNSKVYLHDGYWTDIGTIASYYEANMALTEKHQSHHHCWNCYDDTKLIYSKNYHLPGAMITDSMISKSVLCEGSVIDTSNVTRCVVGVRSVIGANSEVSDTILMGNEKYISAKDRLGLGQGCIIHKAIIDENCMIGNNVRLTNNQSFVEYDSPDNKLFVRDGIIIVPKGTVIPDNYVF